MEPKDLELFTETLGKVASIFGVEMTQKMAEGYWWALEDLKAVDAIPAMKIAAQRCQFIPKPDDIRNAVDKARLDRSTAAINRLRDEAEARGETL